MICLRKYVENVIIGGGHKGCLLAEQLEEDGRDYLLLEMSAFLGGLHRFEQWYLKGQDPLEQLNIDFSNCMTETLVQSITKSRKIIAEQKKQLLEIEAEIVYVATGSYEIPMVFPGWTLPGVLTRQAAKYLYYRDNVPIGNRIVYIHHGVKNDQFLERLKRTADVHALNVSEIENLACFGDQHVEHVSYQKVDGSVLDISKVDAVICASRSLPAIELLQMAGIKLRKVGVDLCPVITEKHETSLPNVFVYFNTSNYFENGVGVRELKNWVNGKTVVCACEEVTYGEIEEAIRNRAETMDDIKRITHCGFGACQWKICRPMVAEILHSMNIQDPIAYQPKLRFPYTPLTIGKLPSLNDIETSNVDDPLSEAIHKFF